jgi:hypothetical protein
VFSLLLGIALAVRLTYLFASFPKDTYADAATYYIPAGEKYINGTLPNAVNPEHPPLAKYIIGFFAVFLGQPSLSSLAFGLIAAILVFAIVRQMTNDTKWGAVALWLFAFDPISIGISVFPVLEVFMITFSLLGIFLVLKPEGELNPIGAGISFGLALACKSSALLILGPTLVWLLFMRRFRSLLSVGVSSTVAFIVPYSLLIAREGFQSFVSLATYEFGFTGGRGYGELPSILLTLRNLFSGVLFHLTTYVQVGGVAQRAYPESVTFFGYPHVSIAEVINPWIMLMLFPTIFILFKRWKDSRDGVKIFFLLILITNLAAEGLFQYSVEPWLYAPTSVALCLTIPVILKEGWRGTGFKRSTILFYLGQIPIWLLFAVTIEATRILLLRG